MEIAPIDNFFLKQDEPNKGCLLALKSIVSNYNAEFEIAWKFRLPCFLYKNKMFCFLWVDKKTKFPYIAIKKGSEIEHPDLIAGNRKVYKLLMIDPNKDIDIDKIHTIFDMAMKQY